MMIMRSPLASTVAIVLAAPLLGCGSSGPVPPAKEAAAPEKGPRLEVEQTSADLGETDFGNVYSPTFPVTNSGDQPLRLTLARKSCACSEVQLRPPDEILPGQTGEVIFRWTPLPGQAGSFLLAADLHTNDPERPSLRLEVKARVTPLVRLWPEDWSAIDFRQIHAGQTPQREVRVFSTDLDHFGLDVSASHPGLRVEKTPLPAGSRVGDALARYGYVVVVTATRDLPKGYFHETLILVVQGDQARRINLPVYGQVDTGTLRIIPPEIAFKKARVTDGDRQQALVQFAVPSEEENLEVVEWDPEFLVVEQPRRLKKGQWQLTVTLPAGNPEAARYQADGFFEGRLILRTTAPTPLEVPVGLKWICPEH